VISSQIIATATFNGIKFRTVPELEAFLTSRKVPSSSVILSAYLAADAEARVRAVFTIYSAL
jgi:hypothetical protein